MSRKANDQAIRKQLLSELPSLNTEKTDPRQAEAILLADRESRAKEYGEIITREGNRLRCNLVGVAEIAGNEVSTRVVVVPN